MNFSDFELLMTVKRRAVGRRRKWVGAERRARVTSLVERKPGAPTLLASWHGRGLKGNGLKLLEERVSKKYHILAGFEERGMKGLEASSPETLSNFNSYIMRQ